MDTHFHRLGIKEFRPHVPSVIDDDISWNAFFVKTLSVHRLMNENVPTSSFSMIFTKTVGLAKPVYICVHVMISYRKKVNHQKRKKRDEIDLHIRLSQVFRYSSVFACILTEFL